MTGCALRTDYEPSRSLVHPPTVQGLVLRCPAAGQACATQDANSARALVTQPPPIRPPVARRANLSYSSPASTACPQVSASSAALRQRDHAALASTWALLGAAPAAIVECLRSESHEKRPPKQGLFGGRRAAGSFAAMEPWGPGFPRRDPSRSPSARVGGRDRASRSPSPPRDRRRSREREDWPPRRCVGAQTRKWRGRKRSTLPAGASTSRLTANATIPTIETAGESRAACSVPFPCSGG